MECPDCGRSQISREVGPRWSPSTRLADVLVDLEEGDDITLHRQCWACGWREDRGITLTEIEAEHGDPGTVAHQHRLTELVNELEAIEDTETLKAIHRDVRHRQSTDVAATDAGDRE